MDFKLIFIALILSIMSVGIFLMLTAVLAYILKAPVAIIYLILFLVLSIVWYIFLKEKAGF